MYMIRIAGIVFIVFFAFVGSEFLIAFRFKPFKTLYIPTALTVSRVKILKKFSITVCFL